MALESCFHVCTLSSNARACVIPKLNLPTCKGLKSSSSSSLNFLTSSSSSSSSSSFSSLLRAVNPSRRRSQVVCKAQEAVDVVRVVTDASWNNLVIANETPVLVEFWAPWCGPCRMIAPVIDEMAKEYAGKISCYKLNTDDCPTIATQYGIRSIPTVLVFKNGEKKESVIGAVPKSTLTSTVEKYLET